MNRIEKILNLFSIILGIGIIVTGAIGIFYTSGGERFTAVNVYGDKVILYGNGIYAYNSILTTANRLGTDAVGIIVGLALIIFTFWKSKALWAEIIRASIIVYLAYHSAYLVFGIAMNRLYLLYIICFVISLYISIIRIRSLFKIIEIPEALRNRRLTGTGVFLIAVGVITALLWGSMIIPAILNNSYSSLLETQTTEVTYGIDLSITCPIFIITGIWVLKKKDIGYKVAPLLLNVMVCIAILVISQRAYCAKLGIDVPIGALIGFVISFVIMGSIALGLVIRLLTQLKKVDTK